MAAFDMKHLTFSRYYLLIIVHLVILILILAGNDVVNGESKTDNDIASMPKSPLKDGGAPGAVPSGNGNLGKTGVQFKGNKTRNSKKRRTTTKAPNKPDLSPGDVQIIDPGRNSHEKPENSNARQGQIGVASANAAKDIGVGGDGDAKRRQGEDARADDAKSRRSEDAKADGKGSTNTLQSLTRQSTGDESSSAGTFMTFFIVAAVIVVVLYLVFHSRHKLMGYIVEGRNASRGGGRRRRAGATNSSSSTEYKPLNVMDEENAKKAEDL